MPLGDEVEGADVVDELAVDRARVVPVEAIEGLEVAEGGGLGASGEVAVLALPAREGAELLEDLHRRQARGGGVGDEREQGFA